jgi:MerR family redox-sensitive transcriptional activator SoxR
MKIGQVARLTGVRPSAIRYYERLGVLPSPELASGQRHYPSDAHDRVLLVRFARDMGFTLAEIKLFLNGLQGSAPVGARWEELAKRKLKEVEASIKRARRLKSLLEHLLHCRCASLRVCVQSLSLSPNLRTMMQSK